MISFKCRHCDAPQTAESKEASHLVVCYQCNKLATTDDDPEPKRSGTKPREAPRPTAEPVQPPKRETRREAEWTPGPFDPSRRPIYFGFHCGFGIFFGMLLAAAIFGVIAVFGWAILQ